jgi:hypothetical protein
MCDEDSCGAFTQIAELTSDDETILDLVWVLAEASQVAGHAAPAAEVSDLKAEHRDLPRSLTDDGFPRRGFYALIAHIEDEAMKLFPTAMLGFDDEERGATDDDHRAVDAAAAAAT